MQSIKACYVTGRGDHLDCHHIFGGPNRKKSDIYGCWVWLTHDIHMALHSTNPELQKQLKQECQEKFEALYGHEQFMRVFGKSYI